MRKFGNFDIIDDFVIWENDFCFSFTDLHPIIEGHVLVVPKHGVQYISLLTPEERIQLFKAAEHVGTVLKTHLHTKTFSALLQDGPAAGQTVPHCHIHIFPQNCVDGERHGPDSPSDDERKRYSALYRSFFSQ